MYAVIRAGGKQYRVAPGDVIHVEQQPAENGKLEFTDVLAGSAAEGQLSRPGDGARVIGQVLEQGRGGKVLVFHYKRKKQYKKLAGHRQPFTRVRITEIVFDGHSYKASEEHAPKKAKAIAEKSEKPHAAAEHKHAAPAQHARHAHAKPASKKTAKSSHKKKK